MKPLLYAIFSVVLAFVGVGVSAQDTLRVNQVAVADTLSVRVPKIVVDEVAAVVGNSVILRSDVERAALLVLANRKKQGAMSERTEQEEAFEMLLTQRLMSTRAEMDSLEKELGPIDGAVSREIDQMVAAAGGIAELERELGKPIYQIRADVTLDEKQRQLSMAMQQRVVGNTTLNYSDVSDFAKTIPLDMKDLVPVQYSYSQIVKIPPQTDERKYAIRERLLEFRKRILAGETSLGALALLYSADPGTAHRRGEMGPMILREFDPAFAEALKTLKPGEVSEIVESSYGYHIIEMIAYTEKPEPAAHIRHILLKPEFTVEESRQVKIELDSIAKEIKAGRLDFAAAALRFSDDELTRENGGRVFKARAATYTRDIRNMSARYMPDELRPHDYRQISRLKPGEISDPFDAMDDNGNNVHKIIKLDLRVEPHVANLNDDFDELAALAIKVKEMDVLTKWLDKEIVKMYIEIKPAYKNYTLERDAWRVAAERSERGENVRIYDKPQRVVEADKK